MAAHPKMNVRKPCTNLVNHESYNGDYYKGKGLKYDRIQNMHDILELF